MECKLAGLDPHRDENVCTLVEYDAAGNRTTTTNAREQRSLTVYDSANRPVVQVANWDGATTMTANGNGCADTTANPNAEENLCTFTAYTTLGRVRSLGDGRYLAKTGGIIDTTRLPASARVRLNPRWDSAARHLAGAGFAFGVSAAFQWFEDASPYLTPEQKVFSAGVSGLGGLTAWAIGAGATQIATGAGVVAWAGPMGIAIGGGVTFVWIKWVQPIIFDYVGANPQRNLMELQSN